MENDKENDQRKTYRFFFFKCQGHNDMRHKRGPSLCQGFSSDMYGIVFILLRMGCFVCVISLQFQTM